MRSLIVTFLLLTASGCATTTVPLQPVTYNQATSVRSDKTATIELQTGIVGGSSGTTIMPVGNNVFIPISSGPIPHLQFNEEDQLIFIDSLKTELNRLGILKVVDSKPASEKKPDVRILILFAQTHHSPRYQEYTLDVAMQIEGSGRTFANKYRAISSEGDSLWRKMNTNAFRGKKKAAEKLLLKIIPDIERWINKNP